jgi:hypothetical protein
MYYPVAAGAESCAPRRLESKSLIRSLAALRKEDKEGN